MKDLLPLYALGILDADEAALVEQAVAADPELAAELAIYQEAADRLIAPAVPSDHVLTRLMASAGQGRWERFSSRISALFDLSLDKTRELLGMMERPTSWGEEAPGIFLIHFPAGPAFGPAADCGIVRITPGSRFPWHTHLGDEHSLVLEGAMTEDNGRQFVAGDELVVVDGSQHDLVNEGTVDCIFIARALNGISVRGM